MSPNSPLPTIGSPIFAEGSGLASSRDARTVGQAWKKARAVSRQTGDIVKTLSNLQNDLRKLRRVRPGGYIPTTFTESPVAGPFSIYQATPSPIGVSINAGGSGYTGSPNGVEVPGGSVLTLVGGTGTPAQITVLQIDASGAVLSAVVTTPGNYTTPPTFPVSCTGGGGSGCMVTLLSYANATQNVCQIRSGCVSARSQLDPFTPGNYDTLGGIIQQSSSQGNYEYVFAVDLDGNFSEQYAYAGAFSDASGPAWKLVYKDSVVTLNTGASIATPKLINGILPDGTDVSFGQIFIPYSESHQVASFWMEIIDQQTPSKMFTVQVWGIMVANQQGGYPSQFPTGPNIIPIGNFAPGPNGGDVVQVQAGNLVNRWPAMKLPVTGGTSKLLGLPEIFRGYWAGDSLSGQTFYDGDVVIDDTSAVAIQASTSTAYRKWQYIAGSNAETTPPSGASTKWQIVGCVINP